MTTRRPLVLLALLLLVIWSVRHVGNAPVDPRSTTTVTLEIAEGTGARAIAQQLKGAGVIRSPAGFVARVVLSGARGALKAGTYELSPRESGSAILGRLARGETLPEDQAITFPEGFTLEQIAERLAARGLGDQSAFRAAATARTFRQEFSFLATAPDDASLEGYLFPDTYRVQQGTPPDDIIRRMLRRFDEQQREAATGTETRDLARTLHQIVTVASIVEREVRAPEDRRLVAGILWRRFDEGRGLDGDATIRYALNKWDGRLTVEDLRVDSPYNTRRYRGLPPGAIGNPGLDALKAAFTPQTSEYLYYLSASDNKQTIFSRTLDEHNEAKAKYLR